MARAKIPANAGNFTCSSQVNRSYTQFTCVTCSLPSKTCKFTFVGAATTSRKIQANCLQAHVNLLEYHGHFTGNFTCGTHANLPVTSMKKCRKYIQLTVENTRIADKKTRQTQEKIPAQSQAKKLASPSRITSNCRQSVITPRVNSPANCR